MYLKLLILFQNSNEDSPPGLTKNTDTQAKKENQCLIDLEELNGTNTNTNQVVVADLESSQRTGTNPFRADDTFTQLANRTPQKDKTTTNGKLYVIPPNHHTVTLDDSGEFAVPASANSEDVNKCFQFPLTGQSIVEIVNDLDTRPLPTPVEVITINNKVTSYSRGSVHEEQQNKGGQSLNPFLNEDLANPNISVVGSDAKNGQTTKLSSNSFGNLCGVGEEKKNVSQPLLPANSESELLKRSISSNKRGHSFRLSV